MNKVHKQYVAVSLALLAGVYLFGTSIVPLYDGVGFPDEAYRYLEPPAGSKPTLEVAGGTAASAVTNSSNSDLIELVTAESGPQVVVVLLPKTILCTSTTAKVVHVSVDPVKPTVMPSDGSITGNVYALGATCTNGQTGLNGANQVDYSHIISLRLPQGGKSGPVMEYRAPGAQMWQRIKTSKTGNDIYQGDVQGLGEYALVEPQLSSQAQPGRDAVKSNHIATIVVALVLVSLVAVTVLIIRIVRLSRIRGQKAVKNGRHAPKK